MTTAYNHREAFCLMWYKCQEQGCGHMERIWNSRDGVTPFYCGCPSCGKPSLQHAYFGSDKCEPEHVPHHGQRMWVGMTKARAAEIAENRVKFFQAMGSKVPIGTQTSIRDDLYQEGHGVDLFIAGYDHK